MECTDSLYKADYVLTFKRLNTLHLNDRHLTQLPGKEVGMPSSIHKKLVQAAIHCRLEVWRTYRVITLSNQYRFSAN
jgi:hypothetical protein